MGAAITASKRHSSPEIATSMMAVIHAAGDEDCDRRATGPRAGMVAGRLQRRFCCCCGRVSADAMTSCIRMRARIPLRDGDAVSENLPSRAARKHPVKNAIEQELIEL